MKNMYDYQSDTINLTKNKEYMDDETPPLPKGSPRGGSMTDFRDEKRAMGLLSGNYPAHPAVIAPRLFSLNREMDALTLSPVLTFGSDAGDAERNKVDAMLYPVVD